MRLLPRDKHIISQIALHAEETVPQLARRCRVKEHTLRYVLNRYTDLGILKKRWVIDAMALGLRRFEVFFSSPITSKSVRESLRKALIKSEAVTYFAEVGGDYDFELIMLARDSHEITTTLASLTRQFGDLALSKSIIEHQQIFYFSRKYLSSGSGRPGHLGLGGARPGAKIEALGHQLLQSLSQHPELSQRDLAKICACSPATIQAHLKRLRAEGVIRGAMYSLSAEALGAQNFIFLVCMKGFGAEARESFVQFCQRHPHCTNLKLCFGEWDFEVGIETMNSRDVPVFKALLLETFPSEIRSIRILSRFSTHKYEFYPFRGSRLPA